MKDLKTFFFSITLAHLSDVVVGAPYEDNERGAVYIYNGYKDGLWPRHSLKILARTLDESLLGFGASFSNEMDMNRDNINGMLP